MYEFKFPFEPPWEDLKMEGTSQSGAKYYIFDTCCKNFTKADKERTDREICRIYAQAAQEFKTGPRDQE